MVDKFYNFLEIFVLPPRNIFISLQHSYIIYIALVVYSRIENHRMNCNKWNNRLWQLQHSIPIDRVAQ